MILGISLNELNRYDEAIQMYDKCTKFNPYNSAAFNNKG